jgi:hypothetical protein
LLVSADKARETDNATGGKDAANPAAKRSAVDKSVTSSEAPLKKGYSEVRQKENI